MKVPQFHFEEFTRLLERAASADGFLHCSPHAQTVIRLILSTDYLEQEDDIEFLIDMVNYEMCKRNYTGQKRRFPATRILDQLCDELLYISTQSNTLQQSCKTILQTARIYSKATGKSTLLAVCSRDSLQVLPVCSINKRGRCRLDDLPLSPFTCCSSVF